MGFATPTGAPCPRVVRLDGTVEGTGNCTSCGCCILLADAAWPSDDGPSARWAVGEPVE